MSTASGNPEVQIEGVTKKQVADKVVDAVMSKGMVIRKTDEYSVVAGKPAEDMAARMFFGSRYDSTPEYRVSFNMVERAQAVRVFARTAIVTNPGSAFERVVDMTDSQKHELQKMLTDLQARLSEESSPSKPPPKP